MSTQTTKNLISRPTADFHPCHWGHHFINITLHDEATQQQAEQKVQQLKVEVGELLIATSKEPQRQFKFIDTLERLGVSYHFEKEIEEALQHAYENLQAQAENDDEDLDLVSLRFRIFRQHGFHIPSDFFEKFKDENGSFKESLTNNVKGLLSLYEASHVRVHEDKILDEALAFTTSHLSTVSTHLTSPLAEQVAHALHQPLHTGMPRVEARFYISIYEQHPSHDKTLLEFAKLDFNLVQSLHQQELKELTRWWKGLHMKASFSRDRMTEAYFWILGVYFEPQYSFARKLFGKIFKSVTLADDTYDAYGTLEELNLLTEAFQRKWDKGCVDELPEHVKWCYYAYVETCEEAEDDLVKEGLASCVHYVREQVKVLSEACLQEAKWRHENYVPTYDEYMKTAIITSPYPMGIVGSFLGMGDIASKEVFEWASQQDSMMPIAVKAASIILRLMNDMGGHEFEQSRNHVASAIQCLMEHEKVSEEEANEKLTKQVENAWKDLNEAMLRPYSIPKPLLSRIFNLACSANVFHSGGTHGYTHVNDVLKEKIDSVVARRIPM